MLNTAITLAELGFAVFPCAPDAKRPLTAHGLNDATTGAEQIERWWSESPTANLAIRTDGLLVIDIDGADNPWPADPDQAASLSAGVLSLTPRGGRHFIFRQPEGKIFRNTASKLAPAVDTRADGGYILVAPSVVDGKPYRWADGSLDVSPDRLPEPPAWLIELLEPHSQEPRTKNQELSAGNPIPDGQRNAALTSLGGAMRRVGMTQSEILDALLRVNADRCRPPLERREVEVIAWSDSRYEPDQVSVAVVEQHAAQDGLATSPPAIGAFPAELLRVPGFIEQVMDHNLAGAYKRQPVLALAGAISLLAVLTGRKIADRFGSRTNLYCVGIGESGCGKERAREINKEILYHAGYSHLLAEGIASHTGLVNAIEMQPATLFQVDEIGRFLKTLGNPNQAPHLYQIATVLMRMFSSSGSFFTGDKFADAKKNTTIDQPHACLYGTTVPRSLYDGLSAESMTDGLVSRLLIFEADEADPDPNLDASKTAPPPKVVDVARWWGDLKTRGNCGSTHPEPLIIPYSADAQSAMVALETLSRCERKADSSISALWTRTTEKARKLALIWACSENHLQPEVTAEAAYWASQLSEYLTRKLIAIGRDHVAENPFEASRKRVLRAVRESATGLTQTQLCRATRHLRVRERQDIVDSLISTGEIVSETLTGTTRPTTVFVAR